MNLLEQTKRLKVAIDAYSESNLLGLEENFEKPSALSGLWVAKIIPVLKALGFEEPAPDASVLNLSVSSAEVAFRLCWSQRASMCLVSYSIPAAFLSDESPEKAALVYRLSKELEAAQKKCAEIQSRIDDSIKELHEARAKRSVIEMEFTEALSAAKIKGREL